MSDISIVKRDASISNFTFNKIFSMDSNQQEIFECTSKDIVDNVIQGYNGTIFAYGQTGSGKTYTIVGEFGKSNKKGIIPRTFEYLFNQIKYKEDKDNSIRFNIKFTFIEIYMEKINDLLDYNQNKKVKIREDPEKGFYIDNCNWIKVKSIKECKQFFEKGEKNRKTESTYMNEHSSRSHALLQIEIEKNDNYLVTRGLLNLVDLAGSEKVNNYKKGTILDQAKYINKSLSVLGACIKKLVSNEIHIPYRESKLTCILKESLGGNAKTSLIVTISPSIDDIDETYNSLNFGKMAMKVKNIPKINQLSNPQNVNFSLGKLQEANKYLGTECEKLDNIIIEKDQKMEELRNQLIEIKDIKKRLEVRNTKLEMEIDNLKEDNQIIIEKKAKDLLMELNIHINEINKHNINSLIYTLLEEIQKYKVFYQNKIKEMENNSKLQNMINNYQQLNKKYINTQTELKIMTDKKDQLKNSLLSLNQNYEELKKQNDELKKKLDEFKKNNEMSKINYDNKISTIISDNKIKIINSYASEAKLNRVQNKISSNQILLIKSINSFLNSIYIYNFFKNYFKKMEIIIENDIPSIIANTYEFTMNKAKNQINIIQDKLENVNYIKNSNAYKNDDLEESINKLNEIIEQNKNNMIEIYIFVNKLFNIIINLCEKNEKKVKKINSINTSKNSKILFYEKNEEKIKGNLLEIISNNLDKFKSIFYFKDNRDLEEDLQYLEKNSYNLNILDFFQKVDKIFEKIISKSADFRKQKDLEIENLNNKILYFLKQIDIYKQNINNRADNSPNDNEKNILKQQIILKEEEIIKLNKRIDELSKKIDS